MLVIYKTFRRPPYFPACNFYPQKTVCDIFRTLRAYGLESGF